MGRGFVAEDFAGFFVELRFGLASGGARGRIAARFKRAAGRPEGVNSYRAWSPDAVMAQIDVLVNDYGVRNIKFADELFD